MLGDGIVERFRIVQNDAWDRPTHALTGTTASGNEIWIHKEYLRADVRILTGFIEPHFFAGFSGGGKACMPGMALLETIVRNHSARNIDHPMATWGVTHGNPIWEEFREAALMVPSSFLLNVALNREKRITGVFAGDIEQAHECGCAFVRRHAMVSVDAPYDIVITSNSGYPLDLSLYQAVKGMSAAARVVKDSGAIILAADCWDGIPDHGQYKKLLFEADGPAALLETIRAGGGHDCWQAQIHASICEKTDVYLFSHNLSDEEIRRAMLKPCRSIAGTVERLLQSLGPDASLCVLPEGPQTIPCLKEKRP
jgi:nickel-dependent lactate racemase